jgi:hypothetical protein
MFRLRLELLSRKLGVSELYRPLFPSAAEAADFAIERKRQEAGGRVNHALSCERRKTLADLSPTAGVDWDDLDAVFAKFLGAKEQRNEDWRVDQGKNWEKAEKKANSRKQRIAQMTKWSRRNQAEFSPKKLTSLLSEIITKRASERSIV